MGPCVGEPEGVSDRSLLQFSFPYHFPKKYRINFQPFVEYASLDSCGRRFHRQVGVPRRNAPVPAIANGTSRGCASSCAEGCGMIRRNQDAVIALGLERACSGPTIGGQSLREP